MYCTIPYTILHGHDIHASFFKFKNHTQLSWMHLNGPSETWFSPQFVQLYAQFTQLANHISSVFCVRQA